MEPYPPTNSNVQALLLLKNLLYNPFMNFEILIHDLVEKGWHLCENFLDEDFCRNAIEESKHLEFAKAKVGGGQTRTTHTEIRNDSIHWLDLNSATPLQKRYLDLTEEIKININRELYLGLKEFECHLALYQKDEFYKKHSDQFHGTNIRTVTAVTYLNTPTKGGELVIYKRNNPNEIDAIVKPKAGLLVCFITKDLYHEVLPAGSERYSFTGWFRNQLS